MNLEDKRILLIDIGVNGHRLKYIETLSTIGKTSILLPKNDECVLDYHIIQSGFNEKRNLYRYYRFINEIVRIVKENHITTVVFLCGDALYRFFGLFLNRIPAEILITFHHVTFGLLKKLSIKRIFSKIKLGVVHTECLCMSIKKCGINNVEHVEYPVFGNRIEISSEESRKMLGINSDSPLLVVVGGTQYYKGIDILLKALNNVKHDFCIYICGPERDLSIEDIKTITKDYSEKVVLNLSMLSDEEYQHALNAADYIVLPYRRVFDGASGPLADSTMYRKVLITSNHGSLVDLVTTNNLGLTFETENIDDLSNVIDFALFNKIKWEQKADSYRKRLMISSFIDKYKDIMR